MLITATKSYEGTKAGYTNLTNGIHHCELLSTKQAIIKHGAETMKGSRAIVWRFKVVEGPCKNALFEYETAIEGYFPSTYKPGQRVFAIDFTYKVMAALNPALKITEGMEIDTDDFIGRECEAEVLVNIREDGTTSLFPKKASFRPWIPIGLGGPLISQQTEPDEILF